MSISSISIMEKFSLEDVMINSIKDHLEINKNLFIYIFIFYNREQKFINEKRYCFGSHKQLKTLLKDHMVKFKTISLYIYEDLRLKTWDLRSNELRDNYHEDGNLGPSPRCGFGVEVVFQLCGLKLNISVYIRIATFR